MAVGGVLRVSLLLMGLLLVKGMIQERVFFYIIYFFGINKDLHVEFIHMTFYFAYTFS